MMSAQVLKNLFFVLIYLFLQMRDLCSEIKLKTIFYVHRLNVMMIKTKSDKLYLSHDIFGIYKYKCIYKL